MSVVFSSFKESIPLAVLLTFCSEGDNIVDAVNLFLYLNDWLKLVPREKVRKTRKKGSPTLKFDSVNDRINAHALAVYLILVLLGSIT